jgi:cell division protease FtsH
MIVHWGMGSLGLMALRSEETQPLLREQPSPRRDYSEETAARIDRDIQRILQDRYQAVIKLLTDAREHLDQLVQMLLHDETIDENVLAKILGPRFLAPSSDVSPPVEIVRAHK